MADIYTAVLAVSRQRVRRRLYFVSDDKADVGIMWQMISQLLCCEADDKTPVALYSRH